MGLPFAVLLLIFVKGQALGFSFHLNFEALVPRVALGTRLGICTPSQVSFSLNHGYQKKAIFLKLVVKSVISLLFL